MIDWQPIETAPKNAERILLYWPAYVYTEGDEPEPVIAVGWWKHNSRINKEYFADTDEEDDYGLAMEEHAPTHWARLQRPQ